MKIRGYIIIGTLLALGGITCCGVALVEKDFDFKALRINYNLQEHDVTKDGKDNLTIDGDCGKITVEQGTEDTFAFSYSTSNYVTVEFEEASDMLTIKQKTSWKNQLLRPVINSFYDTEEYSMKITLPKLFSGHLNIKNDVGEIVISDINVVELTVLCDVGAITVRDSIMDSLSASTDVGSLSINRVSTKKADLHSNVGSVSFSRLIADDVTLRTDVGSISGSMVGIKNDYSVTISIAGTLRESTHGNQGGKKLTASVDVGDVNINWTI